MQSKTLQLFISKNFWIANSMPEFSFEPWPKYAPYRPAPSVWALYVLAFIIVAGVLVFHLGIYNEYNQIKARQVCSSLVQPVGLFMMNSHLVLQKSDLLWNISANECTPVS